MVVVQSCPSSCSHARSRKERRISKVRWSRWNGEKGNRIVFEKDIQPLKVTSQALKGLFRAGPPRRASQPGSQGGTQGGVQRRPGCRRLWCVTGVLRRPSLGAVESFSAPLLPSWRRPSVPTLQPGGPHSSFWLDSTYCRSFPQWEWHTRSWPPNQSEVRFSTSSGTAWRERGHLRH